MKGKIILLFILALVALFAIGFIGRIGLQQMIASIEEASEPNEKIEVLDDILQGLSEAESSVRAFIITRDPQTLGPFKQSAATIETQIQHLKKITEIDFQRRRLERLDTLIGKKYATLTELINVRRDEDGNVLKKVIADIDKLKTEAEVEEQENASRTQQNDPNVFERLFGEEPAQEDSAEMEPSISSTQLNEAISRINEQESLTSAQLVARELRLTKRDNAIMIHIREVMEEIEQAEIQLSSSRTERVKEASEKTINTITTTLVITLILFAFLLSIIFNDISRSRKNREQLKLAKERAEKLARVKEEFLSNMSHEIRTPLNAIIGFTEQLEQSSLTGQQNKHLTRIKSSGDHLLRLINDILDYAKMESGRMELEQTGFKPEREVEEIFDLFESAAEKKGIRLSMEIEKSVPEVVLGDSVRFRQVLINLVNNSLKFTSEGGIHILLDTEKTQEDNRIILKLSVEDTGIGIPEDKLETIFDDFSQADTSTARKYGGSGLGLSIVNKIVKLHQGEVKVTSELDKGTRFDVTMTYLTGTEADLPQRAQTEERKIGALKILVVDDQHYNLELLQAIFENWNVTNDLCENGEEALKMLGENSYDLVLLDIQMPGINGFEVARQFRDTEPTGNHTPIIALTAGTSDEDKAKAKEAGMDLFLSKPFTQDTLRQTILQAIGKPVTNSQKSDNDPKPNLEGLLELANGDMEFVSNMLTIFRNNFDADLQEMLQASREKNQQKVRSLAHKMVPPCGHLGFSQMVGLLRKIEKEADQESFTASLSEHISEAEKRSSGIISEIDKKIKEFDQNKERV
jgi:signal transduction histidine kinase/DNA-binding response OmpR family regulator